MDELVNITLIRLISAYIFILFLLMIVKTQKIGHEWEIILATGRMTVQLILVGYVLTYIFNHPDIFLSLGVLALMELFAIHNIFSRVKSEINKKLKYLITIAMVTGTGTSIAFFTFIILNLKPWYLPQYIIPISGMLIGNSMTGITLGVEGLTGGIKDNKEMIENALMLGATPELSTRDIANRAFYNALLPTLNSMIGMGIIFLPSMMTGQILAGASPLVAIRYQLAIMLGITGSVTLTVYILVRWGARTYFNKRAQLELS
ncbi:ABC transporter permease [Halothermothrix orenii]|uniref:Iron export ABC transporter permease subunit FetB n=1 Tax=Halothermothrix orenii (strain H 168 / OCM 544 / DSM 9562) TaxID=373903 RepID=B8CYE3_HALOH|nr:iron export ABC transporter permease subunit FetB [Halothermothrix orenii]ACL70312.1 conserved hypothetical protein TIGR00245 [Halothermothrix orenii H 168]